MRAGAEAGDADFGAFELFDVGYVGAEAAGADSPGEGGGGILADEVVLDVFQRLLCELVGGGENYGLVGPV